MERLWLRNRRILFERLRSLFLIFSRIKKCQICPGLDNAVNEIFNKQICSYTEMVLAILECCVGDGRVFCTKANKRKDCLFLCFFNDRGKVCLAVLLQMRKILSLMLCKNVTVEVWDITLKLCNIYKLKAFFS